jgi:peroxiredoxin
VARVRDPELAAIGARDRPIGFLLLGLVALAVLVVSFRAVMFVLRPSPPARGEIARPISARAIRGEEVDLARARGKVVLLDFWATWCRGCVAFAPITRRLHRDFAPRGFLLVGVNQEPEDEAGVREWVIDKGIEYPVVIDRDGIAERYGVFELPAYVLIDRAGKVAAVHQIATELQLRREIEALLERVQEE